MWLSGSGKKVTGLKLQTTDRLHNAEIWFKGAFRTIYSLDTHQGLLTQFILKLLGFFFFFNNLTSCIIQVLFYIFSRSWRAPKTKQRDASNECSASELNEFTGLHETPKPHWPVYYTCYQKSYYLFVLPYRKFVVKGLFSLPIMTGLQLPALYYLDMERNETTFTLHVLS